MNSEIIIREIAKRLIIAVITTSLVILSLLAVNLISPPEDQTVEHCVDALTTDLQIHVFYCSHDEITIRQAR